MRAVLILSLAVILAYSAPIGSNVESNLEEERDSKQLLTLAEFRKKVGQVIGEELSKVVNGAFTIPPPKTEAPAPPATEPAPVTEEQTIIVYITEPPPPPEETAPPAPAPTENVAPQSQPAAEVQPEVAPAAPASPPAAPVAPPAAPVVETVPEAVAATELVQEISTELVQEATTGDENEEETEEPESSTADPEEAATNAVEENVETTQAAIIADQSTIISEDDSGSTLYDVSTLPPPFVGKVVDTTEDDERDVGFTFPPIATVSGSIVEEAFESIQSTEPVPLVPAVTSTAGSITPVDEDDDDNEEDEDEDENSDVGSRAAKRKAIIKKTV